MVTELPVAAEGPGHRQVVGCGLVPPPSGPRHPQKMVSLPRTVVRGLETGAPCRGPGAWKAGRC